MLQGNKEAGKGNKERLNKLPLLLCFMVAAAVPLWRSMETINYNQAGLFSSMDSWDVVIHFFLYADLRAVIHRF